MASREPARSDHFDGERFFNPGAMGPVALPTFRDFLRWRRTRLPGPWRPYHDEPPGPPPPERVGGGRLRVTYVNHATVLLQIDGLNVLTDPMWSERASPFAWAGPRRVRPPGLRFDDLPPIDAVLVSHNHYDHLDLPTLRRLAARDRPRLFVPAGNVRALGRHAGRISELDWWDEAEAAPGVTVACVPARHFSQRTLRDHNRALWAGFILVAPSGVVYFAGDTGLGPHFATVAGRFGAPRLALLPIGACEPRWFMRPVHLSPEDAVVAHRALGAATSVAIHFGTFRLGDDGEDEPVRRLEAALDAAGPPRPRFWALGFGDGREVPI